MRSLEQGLALAVPFLWLGMVLAISFLEAPLKFRAPGITLALGLGIGRLVFRASAWPRSPLPPCSHWPSSRCVRPVPPGRCWPRPGCCWPCRRQCPRPSLTGGSGCRLVPAGA
jgi:hypothetical protein